MKNPPTFDVMNPPDWDALWASAEIPGGRNETWREVMSYRTKLPDHAIRLASHGWTPELVAAARDNPYLYWSAEDAVGILDRLTDDTERPTSTVALLVLADETAKWHESRMRLARDLRWMHIRRLAASDEGRWSHERIGTLIGLTRQRIRAIVRDTAGALAYKD